MNIDQFHHGIRAARDVLKHEGASGAIVIMGSQSILAAYSSLGLNADLMMSIEVDIMPVALGASEIERLSDYLDGSLGQDSIFQQAHGFHVDGVSIQTSVLPQGWIHRLIPEVDPVSGATGWCLDPNDLAAAKLVAGRPKDIDFVRILVRDQLVDPHLVRIGLETLADARVVSAIQRLEVMAKDGLPMSKREAWRKRRVQALRDRQSRTTEVSPALILEQLRTTHGESGTEAE